MRVMKQLRKQVSQRKQAFSRGRPGLHVQQLELATALFTYCLQVNAYLTTDHETPEEAFSEKEDLREAGVNLKEACEKWLEGK